MLEPLDIVPLGGLFLIACAITSLALECGYRLGRWRRTRTAEEKDIPVGAMVGAVLGLLAFMLAFTFSMAASRFESRRQVVLEEANAIGTTYLRARLLPEPQRDEAAKLLREYVAVRLRAIQEGKIAEAVARSEELHEELWSQATAAAEKNIAVGMALAGHPPHRSVRAELPHTALTSDVDLQTARSDKDAESSASAAIAG